MVAALAEGRGQVTHPDFSKPVPNPGIVLSEEFDGWGVLLNPHTGAAMDLNPVGLVVWMLMDGQRDLEDVVAEVADRFQGVPDDALEDVAAFVSDLAERGFVRREPESIEE